MAINKIPVKAFSASDLATDVFTATAGQTAFTLSISANVNSVMVYVNDVIQVPTTDYTVSGTTLTFTSSLALNDEVVVRTFSRPSTFTVTEVNNGSITATKLATGAAASNLGFTPAATNQSFYIGTTNVAINRASASLALAGVTLDAATITSGTVARARLGTGTADSTTFLRGDGTWATAGGGGSAATLTTLGTLYGKSDQFNSQASTVSGNSGVGYSVSLGTSNTYSNVFLGTGVSIANVAYKNVAIGSGNNIMTGTVLSVNIGDSSTIRTNAGYNTVIGASNYVSDYCTYGAIVGYASSSYGYNNTVIGSQSRSDQSYSSILGSNVRLQSSHSIGIGYGANDNGYSAIILNGNNSSNSFYANSNGFFVTGVTSGTASDVLYYDSTTKKITYGTPSGGSSSTALNDLTDVVISSPTSGQVLKYDGTNWVNGTDAVGSSGGGGGSSGIAVGNTDTAFAVGIVFQSGGQVTLTTPSSTSNGFIIAINPATMWASVYSVSSGLTLVSLTSGNYAAPWGGIYKSTSSLTSITATIDPMNSGSPVSYESWKITDTAQTQNWYGTSYALHQFQNSGTVSLTFPSNLMAQMGVTTADSVYLRMPSFGDNNRAATLQTFSPSDPTIAYYYYTDSQTLMVRIPGSYALSGSPFGTVNVAGDLSSMGIQIMGLLAGQ